MNPEPAIRAGHQGPLHGPRHRHHRHAAPGGSGARGLAARSRARPTSAGVQKVVRRLHRLDDHASVRHRGARRQEQPRHLLGHAGRGLRPTHRRPRTDGVLPQPLQDRADSQPGSRRRQLSRGTRAAPSPTATRSSTWMPWRSSPRRCPRREDDLWKWQLPDGRGMAQAVAYMYPFIADKKKWPLPPDVMYDKEWPVRQPCLLFAGLALDKPEYLALWQQAGARSDGGRGAAQLPRPPAGALGLITPPSSSSFR